MPLYLRGRALEFYATLPTGKQKDYSKLVITLKQTFVDMHRRRCAAIELRTRTKLEKETIFQYAEAMRKLARQAFPSLSYLDQNRNACLDFAFGLPPHLGTIPPAQMNSFPEPNPVKKTIPDIFAKASLRHLYLFSCRKVSRATYIMRYTIFMCYLFSHSISSWFTNLCRVTLLTRTTSTSFVMQQN